MDNRRQLPCGAVDSVSGGVLGQNATERTADDFGRDKQTGAPLGMQHEHDVPDYASDPEGKVIALDSHIRLANPRTPESESSLMLRRGYSYSLGVTNSGQLDMGLLFVCYQHDLEKGFLTVQKGSMAKRWRNTLNLSAAVIFRCRE